MNPRWLQTPLSVATPAPVRFLRYTLCATAIISLTWAVILSLGYRLNVVLGGLWVRAHSPLKPLTVALLCGSLLVGLEQFRSLPRLFTARYGLTRLATVIVLFLGALISWGMSFSRSTPDIYPAGDASILEIYTRHALRGLWTLGPYSRLGWHHPGPMYFYLLAPIYALGGHQSMALNAGAFVINIMALISILWIVTVHAARGCSIAVMAAVATYVFRTRDIILSYWNPHAVVLPIMALLVVAAAAASGSLMLLPVVIIAASFVTQTHVGVLPCAGAVAVTAFGTCAWRCRKAASGIESWGRFLFWANLSAWVLAVLWLLPLVDELSTKQGNLTRLYESFVASPRHSLPLSTSIRAWSDMLAGLLRPGLRIPVGAAYSASGGPWATGLAVLQLILLVAVVCRWLVRPAVRPFHESLCLMSLIAGAAGLWSVMRIQDDFILDHAIFWISAVGALSWGALGGVPSAALVRIRSSAAGLTQATVPAAAILMTLAFTAYGMFTLTADSDREANHTGESSVQPMYQALRSYLRQEQIGRPLIKSVGSTWGDAAGVILQLYKDGIPVAVDESLVWMFGKPLAPTGLEDADFEFTDTAADDDLSKRPRDRVVVKNRVAIIRSPRKND